VGDGQPFQRFQCSECGAHNPPRGDHPYCSVCGSTELVPVEGPPLITRPESVRLPSRPERG
jgi:ribosomal protein L40E